MIQTYKLYPYGFILSKNKIDSIPEYYKYEYILNSYHFSYDPSHPLNLYQIDDKFILIHGHFLYLGNNNDLTYDKLFLKNFLNIYYSDYDEFLNTLDYLGGRYCIIIGSIDSFEVFQDASGARSVYYTLNDDIVSSHANLINDVVPCQPFKLGTQSTYPRFSFDNSPYQDVKSLVPNFKLNFKSKTIERFFPRSNNRYTSLNDKEKVSLVEKLWKKQLEHYNNKYENLLISITGGNDSRISLALGKSLKDDLVFFTYCKNPHNIDKTIKREIVNEKDRIIVEQILNDIPLNHKFIYYDDRDLEISSDIDYVLSKNSIAKHGRFLINLYLNNFPNNNNMHLRGTCLEIVQSVYIDPKINSNNATAVLDRYLFSAEKYFHLLDENKFKEIGLKGINSLGYNQDQFDFHVLDLYYWEHRMGRWHPELLNETDIAFDTFLPFNVRAILEIGMAFSLNKRKSGFLFKELINNSYPLLNFYGVNNTYNIYEQNKKYLNGLDENNLNKEKKVFPLIFSKYKIYDYKNNNYHVVQTSNNILKIPINYFSENNFSFLERKFSLTQGCLEISLISNYSNEKAKNHLKYQVLINGDVILEEDMSKWTLENNINILNLSKGDSIIIRVVALKNLSQKSWENASRLQILKINEKEMMHINNINHSITCSSPYSIIK